MTEHNFAWFAGVDWGSEGHQACLVDAQGRIVGERRFLHGGTGLADLCDWLLSIGGAADTVAGRTPPRYKMTDASNNFFIDSATPLTR